MKTDYEIDEWRRLVEFVEEFQGKSVISLTPDTELFSQLGLEGDDAFDFLERFAAVFSIDMSGFDYKAHFGPEGLDSFSVIVSLFSQRKYRTYEPVTLGELHAALVRGRWKK